MRRPFPAGRQPLMRRLTRPASEGVGVKDRLRARLQRQRHPGLRDPVADPFDGQLGGPAASGSPFGYLVGGGQSQAISSGLSASSSRSATASSTVSALIDRHVGVAIWSTLEAVHS